MKQDICLDTRLINSSGIGTYLRNILNRIKYLDLMHVSLENIPIYGIQEQLYYPLRIPCSRIFWSPHYNIPILPIKSKYRITTIHDTYHMAFWDQLTIPQKVYAKTVMGAAVNLSDIIITVSNHAKSEILKYFNCDENKIQVIYNGIDPNFAEGSKKTLINRPYILTVGNLKPHKNLSNALRAFKIFSEKNPDYLFCIVGQKDGFITNGIEDIRNVIKGIESKVIFTGFVSEIDLKSYFANASLFMFPSYYEGFGLPILEAMSFGIPIISSNATSLKEVGNDAVLYFNPYDVEDICDKMNMIVDSLWTPSEAKYISNLAKFSWDKSAEQHVSIFNSLL